MGQPQGELLMSTCYGYGRHSTNKQELTAAAQEHRCLEYYNKHLKDRGVEWGGNNKRTGHYRRQQELQPSVKDEGGLLT